MKKSLLTALAFSTFACQWAIPTAHAGIEQKSENNPAHGKGIAEETRTVFPDWPPGSLTFGAAFSEDLTGGYLDAITSLWASRTRQSYLFLNSRYRWEDNDQFISSTGLGFRQMILENRAIVGANVFWDSIDSANGHDFNQLGIGFEFLTKWVDFRFNYYLPEDDQYEIGRSSNRSTTRSFAGASGIETTRTSQFRAFEAGLEGFNTEVGFLVPGLDRYADVRLYAGYYHYDNPFGGDFDGFKARMEARVLQGVTLDLEYWDDAELNGGNWTGGVRVSLPFTFGNLFRGRNPFEGAGETFKPYQRELKDRMGDMIVRSHRVQTVSSEPTLVGTRTDTRVIRPFGNPNGGSGTGKTGSGGGTGFPIE
jgi:hypothetical protein